MNFDALLELFQQRIPAHPSAQIALYLVALCLIAALAQWLFGHVMSRIAHRLLKVWGKTPWSTALTRHRAYRRFGYAVGFAVITVGIGEVPHMGRYAVAIERLAHASLWICFFLMLGGVLGAWQDVYASSRRAQTRSIKGRMPVAATMPNITMPAPPSTNCGTEATTCAILGNRPKAIRIRPPAAAT